MSQQGGIEAISGSASPRTLKRKRGITDNARPRPSLGASSSSADPRLINGASSSSTSSHSRGMAGSNGAHHTSPDSDEMQIDNGDMLRGVGSASSLGSTASSVFTQNSQAFAANARKASANGYTPLTNHTDSSSPKGNSPHHSKSATTMASHNGASATTHMPTTDIAPHTQRPQMLPPPGKVKGYRAVWDPELDSKLSREERKRATFKKRDFGTEVRHIFHILLSLRNMIHIT